MNEQGGATPKKHDILPTPHASRAASAAAATSNSSSSASASNSSSNQDIVFIPPKTPVRSKTRETQYNTPKLVTKSGIFRILANL